MKIGVISDTHGDVNAWLKAYKLFVNSDYILHAGDILNHGVFNPILSSYNPKALAELLNESQIPIIFTKGNCDSEVDQLAIKNPLQTPFAFLLFKDLNILILHGHQYTPEELKELGDRWGVDLIVSGHTHIPRIEKHNNLILLNPGSASLPKGGSPQSVALLSEDGIKIVNLDTHKTVIEERWP